MFNRWRFYDEDDGGGSGGDPTPKKSVSTTPDTVKELVDTFKAALSKVSAPQAAAQVVPATTDPAEEARARKARYDEVKKKANDLAATGDTAAAVEVLAGYMQEEAGRNRRPVDDDPLLKSAVSLARKVARSSNPEVFEKYGEEIEEHMKTLSADRRFDPEAYEDAIRVVRARHIDDIIKEQVAKALEESRAADAEGDEYDEAEEPERRMIAPRGGAVSRPGRVPSRSDDPAAVARRMSPQERGVAKSLGMTPEEYAKAVVSHSRGGRTVADGRVNVPILEEAEGLRIEPGKF